MISHTVLQKIWLDENQAKIYTCLLENDKQSISDISVKTSINRPSIYKTLPVMLELGIVYKVMQWKSTFYKAAPPSSLEELFHKTQRDFEWMMEYMKSIYVKEKQKPEIRYFEWKKWFSFVMRDIVSTLQKWDSFYRYSARKPFEIKEVYSNKAYKAKRDVKQLERYVITSEKLQKSKKKKLEKDVVIIPTEYDPFDDNISKFIYWSKVAVMDYNTNISFIIESQVMANFEKKIFKLLFKFLKKV